MKKIWNLFIQDMEKVIAPLSLLALITCAIEILLVVIVNKINTDNYVNVEGRFMDQMSDVFWLTPFFISMVCGLVVIIIFGKEKNDYIKMLPVSRIKLFVAKVIQSEISIMFIYIVNYGMIYIIYCYYYGGVTDDMSYLDEDYLQFICGYGLPFVYARGAVEWMIVVVITICISILYSTRHYIKNYLIYKHYNVLQ